MWRSTCSGSSMLVPRVEPSLFARMRPRGHMNLNVRFGTPASPKLPFCFRPYVAISSARPSAYEGLIAAVRYRLETLRSAD